MGEIGEPTRQEPLQVPAPERTPVKEPAPVREPAPEKPVEVPA